MLAAAREIPRPAGESADPRDDPLLLDSSQNDGLGFEALAVRSCFALLPHYLDSLDHELEAIPAPFGAGDGGFDFFEGLGIVELLAQFLDEGMNLGVDEKHLAAESGSEEQFFV